MQYIFLFSVADFLNTALDSYKLTRLMYTLPTLTLSDFKFDFCTKMNLVDKLKDSSKSTKAFWSDWKNLCCSSILFVRRYIITTLTTIWLIATINYTTEAHKTLLKGIKERVFFGRNIEHWYLYCPDKNFYYFWKSNISVINSIAGFRDMIEVLKNMSL